MMDPVANFVRKLKCKPREMSTLLNESLVHFRIQIKDYFNYQNFINIGLIFLPVVEMVGLDYRSAVVAVFMIWWALAYSAMAGSAYVLNHWRHMSVAYGAYELLLVITFAL